MKLPSCLRNKKVSELQKIVLPDNKPFLSHTLELFADTETPPGGRS